jgi:hypothetical protein
MYKCVAFVGDAFELKNAFFLNFGEYLKTNNPTTVTIDKNKVKIALI